jgi:hypothetical protein
MKSFDKNDKRVGIGVAAAALLLVGGLLWSGAANAADGEDGEVVPPAPIRPSGPPVPAGPKTCRIDGKPWNAKAFGTFGLVGALRRLGFKVPFDEEGQPLGEQDAEAWLLSSDGVELLKSFQRLARDRKLRGYVGNLATANDKYIDGIAGACTARAAEEGLERLAVGNWPAVSGVLGGLFGGPS